MSDNLPQEIGPGPVQLGNGDTLNQGGMGRRLLARLLDSILVGVPLWIIFAIFGANFFDLETSEAVWTGTIWATIFALYEIWLISARGQTVGKQALGVTVVNHTDGNLPSVSMVFQRWFVYGVASAVGNILTSGFSGLIWLGIMFTLLSFLVFLSPLFGFQRRGWHDQFANTVVVRV